MLFTSYEFLMFLGVVFLLYYLLPKKIQWCVLLLASYVFYAIAGVEYLAFIAVTTLTSYIATRLMGRVTAKENKFFLESGDALSKDEKKAYRAKYKKRRFLILSFALLVGFGILAVLKYTAFVIASVNTVANTSIEIPSLILPLGISFYTFQTMGYLIDVYRAKAEAEKNIFKLALFVSFFPQLIQGPISRFSSLAPRLFGEHRFDRRNFTYGLQRILWGYFKKLVIADRVMIAIKPLISSPDGFEGAYVFLLIIFYSIQIYADFTGGIDITIGVAEALGIKLTENFVRPFSSKSTKEYWNRWHITMGSWFTDYIFYPLSVCRPMLWISKRSRSVFGKNIGKRIPVYLATLITWFLTGLWHGAGWNFIVWGLLNAVVILISQELEPLYSKFRKRFPKLVASYGYGAFMSVRTFLIMGLIRSLDCYRDVPTTFRLWGTMFTNFNLPELMQGGIASLGLSLADYIIILVGCLLMFAVSKIGEKVSVRDRLYDRPVLFWMLFGILFIAVILFGAYSVGYDASQFIYNQF